MNPFGAGAAGRSSPPPSSLPPSSPPAPFSDFDGDIANDFADEEEEERQRGRMGQGLDGQDDDELGEDLFDDNLMESVSLVRHQKYRGLITATLSSVTMLPTQAWTHTLKPALTTNHPFRK